MIPLKDATETYKEIRKNYNKIVSSGRIDDTIKLMYLGRILGDCISEAITIPESRDLKDMIGRSFVEKYSKYIELLIEGELDDEYCARVQRDGIPGVRG